MLEERIGIQVIEKTLRTNNHLSTGEEASAVEKLSIFGCCEERKKRHGVNTR